MQRRRGQVSKKMTSSEIVLGARRFGKTGMFMRKMKEQAQHTTAEYYEKIAIEQLKCLRIIAKERGLTYEHIAEATGMDRTNIGRTLSGKNFPRFDNFLKLYHTIVGRPWPDLCAGKTGDILSFEECMEEEIETSKLITPYRNEFKSLVDKAKKSYESQFKL